MKLFVTGIPYDMDDIDLGEMFGLYSEVRSAKVVMDRATGKSKGFGFVEIPNEAEARVAMQLMNGAGFKGGKRMTVVEATEQPRTRSY